MKVLVTGGTGFIGGHVVAALAKDGHIRLLVRRPEQVRVTLDPLDAGRTRGRGGRRARREVSR